MTHSPGFGALFSRVDSDLRAWLRRSLPPQEIDDIAQEAWTATLEYGPEFEALSLAYLKKVAVSVLSRRARSSNDALRHAVTQLADDVDSDAGEVGAPAPCREADQTMARVQTQERQRLVHAALGSLAPEPRYVLTLTYFYCLQSKEVGRILGLTDNAVYLKNVRARTKLRGLLPDWGHLGGEAATATATLFHAGGARTPLTIGNAQARAFAAGRSLVVELRTQPKARSALDLTVAECWAIAHFGDDPRRISAPTRALWSTDPSSPGRFSVQLPVATSGEDDGLAELFLFAGPWFPGV